MEESSNRSCLSVKFFEVVVTGHFEGRWISSTMENTSIPRSLPLATVSLRVGILIGPHSIARKRKQNNGIRKIKNVSIWNFPFPLALRRYWDYSGCQADLIPAHYPIHAHLPLHNHPLMFRAVVDRGVAQIRGKKEQTDIRSPRQKKRSIALDLHSCEAHDAFRFRGFKRNFRSITQRSFFQVKLRNER
jgi:hypothetical protein